MRRNHEYPPRCYDMGSEVGQHRYSRRFDPAELVLRPRQQYLARPARRTAVAEPNKRYLECFVVIVHNEIEGVACEDAFDRPTWDD